MCELEEVACPGCCLTFSSPGCTSGRVPFLQEVIEGWPGDMLGEDHNDSRQYLEEEDSPAPSMEFSYRRSSPEFL